MSAAHVNCALMPSSGLNPDLHGSVQLSPVTTSAHWPRLALTFGINARNSGNSLVLTFDINARKSEKSSHTTVNEEYGCMRYYREVTASHPTSGRILTGQKRDKSKSK